MHIYTLDGEDYLSVTSIIKLISTNDDLMKWANYMGFKRKDINVLKKESTEFGTLVHSHLRKLVDSTFNDPIPFKNGMEEYRVNEVLNRFKNRFREFNYKTIYTEKTIISKELGYAGTFDWLMEFDNNLKSLNDFKTSKRIYNTMFLQLGGYYNLLKSIGEYADMGSIIIANEYECQLYPVDRSSLEGYGELFNLLFKFYSRWSQYCDPIIKRNLLPIKKTDW